MKKALLITVCLSMATVGGASAAFAALPVIDIGAIAELVATVKQAESIYNQSVTTYNQMVAQAKHLASPSSYRTKWKSWLATLSGDTYGHNAGYLNNVNGALAALSASLRGLPNFGGVFGPLHPATVDRIQWQYSLAELHDGVMGHALDTAGDVQGDDQNPNLDHLDDIVYSDDDLDNTIVDEMHKTAIGTAILAHESEDAKRLLTVLVSQQTLDLKAKRDAIEQQMTVYQEWLTRAEAHEPESYFGIGASAQIDAFAL